jgi:hypothetical protein
MKKMHILGLVLVFVIAFTTLVPAPFHLGARPAAAGVTISKLTIDNKTTKMITVVLKGPKNYTIYALPGKTDKDIAAGKYTYEYTACGLKKTGILKAISAKVKLKINTCPTTKLIIINYSSTQLSLSMNGPDRYTFSVAPKTVTRVVVMRGTYKWSGSWCGASKTGTVVIKGNASRWSFWGC